MTYREVLAHLGLEDTAENLFRIGQWLNEDGAAAVEFPDAPAPLEEEDGEWEYRAQGDLDL